MFVAFGAIGLVAVNCTPDPDTSTFRPPPEPTTDPVGEDGGGSSGSSGVFGNPDAADAGRTCKDLECQQVVCPTGSTTLSGTVFAPEGSIPVYNAIVYVPNSPPTPFTDGVVCEQCGKVTGNPLVTAITNEKGQFTLQNVPVGNDIPLVVQVGKWRRQTKVSKVEKCVDTAVPTIATRLPRSKDEGDIPRIAVSTGKKDTLECFLRKIGIEQKEFTLPSGTGRVHLFAGNGAGLGAGTPASTTLWNSAANLKKYDITMLGCEGDADTSNKEPYYGAMGEYLYSGGRVFATHFHRAWFAFNAATPGLIQTADWGTIPTTANPYHIDTDFPKGKAFADWLVNAGASSTPGLITLGEVKNSVGDSSAYSRRWIRSDSPKSATYFTFNTPVGQAPDKQCGRGVFTDVHVVGGDVTIAPTAVFPNHCTTTGLSTNEKALLFLFFDLSSCVQDETKPPLPPPPIPK